MILNPPLESSSCRAPLRDPRPARNQETDPSDRKTLLMPKQVRRP